MTDGQERRSIFLYTDEDITDLLALLLRERGYGAESALGVGTTGLPDEEQLAFAASRCWTLLTSNRDDFTELARQWYAAGREHAGIVISQQFSRREVGEILRQACNLLEAVSAPEMWNTVRYLQSYR
jgi:Domain of unknown function (DUF5615)